TTRKLDRNVSRELTRSSSSLPHQPLTRTSPMTTRRTTTSDRWRGVLYGLAYGDAWGWPVEFTSHSEIVRLHGLKGPDFPTDAVVTDDTQMTLALADALS